MIESLSTCTPDGRPYKFLFVCGHMRSGTNWVCNLLRGHPDVQVHGEGPFGHISTAISEAKKFPWLYSSRDKNIQQVLDESFAEMCRNCMLQLATLEPNKSWIADSTSRQLWPYIPGTHHIHVQRDVRDVIVSWTYHQLTNNLAIGEPWATRLRPQLDAFRADPDHFKKHPEQLLADEQWVRFVARVWNSFMGTALHARRRSDDGTLSMKVLNLVYEEMLEDAEKAKNDIFAFLDLDPSVVPKVSAKNRTAAGFDREDPNSHFRSGRRGDWERYATDDFKRWVKETAGARLVELGYEKDMNW